MQPQCTLLNVPSCTTHPPSPYRFRVPKVHPQEMQNQTPDHLLQKIQQACKATKAYASLAHTPACSRLASCSPQAPTRRQYALQKSADFCLSNISLACSPLHTIFDMSAKQRTQLDCHHACHCSLFRKGDGLAASRASVVAISASEP